MDEVKTLVNISLDGKPLEKLIDVVSKGIATLYRPRQIRKEAEAKAYAVKVLEKAVSEAGAEKMMVDIETQERITQRIVAQEIRRQNNIDSVVESAAGDLKGKQVSDEPVDEDWATRFFGIVQDVSRDEMKVLWAKILSKEIERPSSFSMRTLDTLKNLSAKEAELFEKVTRYVLLQGDYFIFSDLDALERLGVGYDDLQQLRESGLLLPGDLTKKVYKTQQDKETNFAVIYGKYAIMITLPKSAKTAYIPIVGLTKAGKEIFSLLEPEINVDYMNGLAGYIKKEFPTARISYIEYISITEKGIEYDGTPISL